MTSYTETESEFGSSFKATAKDMRFSTPVLQTKVGIKTTPPLLSTKDHSKAEFSVHGIRSQKLEFSMPPSESSGAQAPPPATVSVKTEPPEIPTLPPMTTWSPDDDLPLIELKDPETNRTQKDALRLGGNFYSLKYDGIACKTFVCSCQKSCKCPGKVKFIKATGEYQEQEAHSQQCKARTARGGKIENKDGSTDLTEFQRDMITTLARDFTKTANPIAEEVIRECDSLEGPYIGMRKTEVGSYRITMFWCFGVFCLCKPMRQFCVRPTLFFGVMVLY